MKRFLALAALTGCATSAETPMPTRPVTTYSIVARDPATGEFGVAVQSHWFSVGPLVPWAEAGVGVVATQSFVNVSFGPRGLALMRKGRSAAEALAELIASDEGEAVRQVALVDAKGRAATHTGSRCIQSAGHHVGEGYSVQANMMRNDEVVSAMAKAYEGAQGPLAERLLTTLDAAQAAGGDIRGKQSAAILVVSGKSTGAPWRDRLVDLRIEDHASPLEELRRIYTIHLAYEHMNAGDAAMEEGDMERALAEYAAAQELAPGNVEVVFWNAFTLAVNGQLDESLPLFKRAFAADESWMELLKRLPASELVGDEVVKAVLQRTGKD